jgi:hypothetical protein
MPVAPDTSIEARLDIVEALLRQVLAVLERPPRPPLTREDRRVLARLLPVLGATFGSEGFSSRDVVEDTSPALQLAAQGLSVKSIGRLLARAEGLGIDGLMVVRQGTECHVTLWSVVGVS